MARPLIVANCSGYYGDRLSAAREMVDGGPIDMLTGDWLAELTMYILAGSRAQGRAAGYATTFVQQVEDVLADCLDRGIRIVANAGGLAPLACAEAVRELAARQGLCPVIAVVTGDDLSGRLGELRDRGVGFAHLDTGAVPPRTPVLTANAYLGGWGIAEALGRGADIVITGRVTDAALTVGPAAWHHGWAREDWDQLAGAVVAGHAIECGAQVTGGNFSFFTEIPELTVPGFPIAEVSEDGSSTITKHPGHQGLVSVETVTAQLLYEIAGPEYLNPDVTALFDTITLTPDGPNRVRVHGARGQPPPPMTKVAMTFAGGFATTGTLYLTGLDIEAKAAFAERALWRAVDRASFDSTEVELIRTDVADPPNNHAAMAQLRITVRDRDRERVGKAFVSKVMELGLSNYPGYFVERPPRPHAFSIYWPTLVPNSEIRHEVVIGDETTLIAGAPQTRESGPRTDRNSPVPPPPGGPTRRVPLGSVVGARSGDKGGNANLGVWARTPAAYAWLSTMLTADRLQALLPETADLPVTRYDFPKLLAVNFVIQGLLGHGVSANARLDGQAKSLGEYLRARFVDVPVVLLGDGD